MGLSDNVFIYQFAVYAIADFNKIKGFIGQALGSDADKRTLDVCCGPGNCADLAKGNYIGFDINRSHIEYARKKFKQDTLKEFKVSDIADFEFKPKSFNNILLINALHHFDDVSSLDLLDKLNRAAIDRIIITDAATETNNPISRLLMKFDAGRFIRTLPQQEKLISQKMDIIRHFTYYAGLAHGRILVCRPRAS